jgi:hypothetical protein
MPRGGPGFTRIIGQMVVRSAAIAQNEASHTVGCEGLKQGEIRK